MCLKDSSSQKLWKGHRDRRSVWFQCACSLPVTRVAAGGSAFSNTSRAQGPGDSRQPAHHPTRGRLTRSPATRSFHCDPCGHLATSLALSWATGWGTQEELAEALVSSSSGTQDCQRHPTPGQCRPPSSVSVCDVPVVMSVDF